MYVKCNYRMPRSIHTTYYGYILIASCIIIISRPSPFLISCSLKVGYVYAYVRL